MAAAKTGNWLLNVNFIGNFEILKQHILTQISVENMQYRGDYVCIIKYEHKTTKKLMDTNILRNLNTNYLNHMNHQIQHQWENYIPIADMEWKKTDEM